MMDGSTSDVIKVLLENQKEENVYVRHYEETRFKITQMTLALSGLLIGALKFGGQNQYQVLFGMFIILLGGLGSIISAKYTERADRHATLARVYRRAYSDLIGKTQVGALESLHAEAVRTHNESPQLTNRLFRRARARFFWVGIHVCMAILGIFVVFSS